MLQAELEGLSKEMGRSWRVLIRHVERVKWYAPHIRHIVLDVECRPEQAAVLAPKQATSPNQKQATRPVPDQATSSALTLATSPAPDQATSPLPDQARGSTLNLATSPAPDQAARLMPHQAASQGSHCNRGTVAEHFGITRGKFERRISAKKEPAVLKGLDLGPAVTRCAAQVALF